MPTPDPSLLPSLITSAAGVFTSNWTTLLAGVLAIIGVVKLPAVIASGALRGAFAALTRVFGSSSADAFNEHASPGGGRFGRPSRRDNVRRMGGRR